MTFYDREGRSYLSRKKKGSFANQNFIRINDYFTRLKNPEKYGGKRPITLRSSYEIRFAKWADANPDVIMWANESFYINYIFNGKTHKYYPDFTIKVKDKDGNIKQFIVEIKPKDFTVPPKPQKRRTKRYMNKVEDYCRNQQKWKYARLFCERLQQKGKDVEFKIITEDDLGIKR